MQFYGRGAPLGSTIPVIDFMAEQSHQTLQPWTHIDFVLVFFSTAAK